MKLNNKCALITGGNGVIGKAIAKAFLAEGARVLIAGRSAESLALAREELIAATGLSPEVCVADVAKPEHIKNLMNYVGQKFGRLDILVTAAGIYGEIGTVEVSDPLAWQTAFAVNVFGTMAAVACALPLLKQSARGKIITFGGGGEGALPHFSSYASSKAAVLRFTETVAEELKEHHIDVNAISPGLINSGFVEDLIAAGPERTGTEKYSQALQELNGERSTVPPEKAAALAVWLASEASNGLTGKNISAVWDNWNDIPSHLEQIMKSDVYASRRVKPKDRGYDW